MKYVSIISTRVFIKILAYSSLVKGRDCSFMSNTERKESVCEVYSIHDEAVEDVKKNMITREQAEKLAETFKVLGDPNRLKLINALARRELCVCDIAFVLGMSTSAVSHQLRILRSLRLVKYRKKGKQVYYTLDDEHILNLFKEGLEHIKHT